MEKFKSILISFCLVQLITANIVITVQKPAFAEMHAQIEKMSNETDVSMPVMEATAPSIENSTVFTNAETSTTASLNPVSNLEAVKSSKITQIDETVAISVATTPTSLSTQAVSAAANVSNDIYYTINNSTTNSVKQNQSTNSSTTEKSMKGVHVINVGPVISKPTAPLSTINKTLNTNVTEEGSAVVPEDVLIPPADVNASIAQIDTQPNKKGQIIISSESDCPSLVDADSLSQTQLLQRLTHECRYDRLERPITFNERGERLPVNVSARAYIYFLQNLEAHDLQFKIHALLQLRFVDPRLVFKEVAPKRLQPILGENSLREALWVPHIFLANERDSSILGTAEKDVLTSISPDGTVIISTRIQATLYCWMNLQKFPFDEQHCSTVLESWMYNTSELVLHWEQKSPVTLAPELHLTEYVILKTWTNESIINADLSDLRHGAFAGNYSSLSFTVHLAREMGFYLMDYFLPSMMIVAISWVSFWLQADQSAPRIMLGTSTMLTFITLASAQGKTLPKVSYIKVSEVWFLGCTGFIFGSLVEFAFVNTIWRRKKNVELKKVNSKYILKSTLTPRPARKEMGLHKSRSCSSLEATGGSSNNPSYNNYLTVHSFSSKNTLPTITTQSVDDLIQENGSIHINIEPSPSVSTLPIDKNGSQCPSPAPQAGGNTHYGWTTMTPQEISMWIDRRSRFLFPCAFVVFNALFWTFVYYL